MKRKEHELPSATARKGMKYHHLGVPTTDKKPNEVYLEKYKFYVSGFDTSEFGIEWMRFEEDSPISEIIQKVPHLAFEVENLEEAIKGYELIGEVSSPMEGIKVAMILENGAPVEFMEFDRQLMSDK